MGTRQGSPIFTVTRRFSLFIEQADRLAGRRLVQSGMDTSLAITVGGGQATVSWNRPDEEEFQAFLVDLRPFISDREPVFLNTVYNVIEIHITDPDLCEEARRSRRILRDVEAGADLRRGDRSPAQIAGAYHWRDLPRRSSGPRAIGAATGVLRRPRSVVRQQLLRRRSPARGGGRIHCQTGSRKWSGRRSARVRPADLTLRRRRCGHDPLIVSAAGGLRSAAAGSPTPWRARSPLRGLRLSGRRGPPAFGCSVAGVALVPVDQARAPDGP
jgi:hypothetical protein